MEKCKTIMVTSCKGGVGKSTVAANLAIRLAYDGYKTLVIDCDFGVRSLDLIMGLEDEVVFDILDIIIRGIPASKAAITDRRSQNLMFIAAPYSYDDELSVADFKEGIAGIKDELSPDYIIIDTPGDTGMPFRLASAVADMALVVSTYQPISIRAAERTGILLGEEGVGERRLLINCFDPDGRENTALPSLTGIIDKTSIRLIGIIPYEPMLVESQSRGEDVFTLKKTDVGTAFANVANRINGRNVPLFTDFKQFRRVPLLRKIQ